MTDIQSAAERLRRHMADPNHRDTYHGKESTLVGDWATLARAYLAEHPADDGEAITEDWLRAVGFKSMPSEVGLWLDKTVGVDLRSDTPGCVVCNARPRIATRGDLRRLAEALGIPLEPSP
jgi:hypothetical protein